jgi:hypothetical protein
MAEFDQQMRIEDKTGLEEQDSKHPVASPNLGQVVKVKNKK